MLIDKIQHPYGNFRSLLLKNVKKGLQSSIKFVASFFCKFDSYDKIIISSATHAPWLRDLEFINFFKIVKQYTLLDEPRAYTLWQFAKNLDSKKGNILDIGCLLGGAGFLMSKANKIGSSFLFDTFAGFKKNDGLHKRKTFFFSDINFVKRNIKNLKLKNTSVYKAYFPKNINIKIGKVKLCHLDINTYKETKKVFKYLQNKLIKGGVIVFDDFGIWGADGIKKFIYEIYPRYKNNYFFIKNYMGQCILIKKY